MKTLLTIIKEPEKSKDIIKYVLNLARDLDLNIHLLHTQNPEHYPIGGPGSLGTANVHIQENLESLTKEAKKTLTKHVNDITSGIKGDVHIEISAEIGSAKFIADQLISEKKANMIALEGFENDNFWAPDASNIDIIRHVKCPVWIIPHNINYHPYNEIIYATDYREADISTMKKLLALIRRFAPVITALHITDDIDFSEKVKKTGFLEIAKKNTDYNKINFKVLSDKSDDDIASTIDNYALRINANLIVVLKENKNFLDRIFKGSSTKKIIRHTHLPVLVYHENSSE
jgi:nucleotide-binding universal stress UspA family protein